MNSNTECMKYLEKAKAQLIEEFPNNNDLNNTLFLKICDFVNEDFDGIAENKIYRSFILVLIDIIEIAFESDASKSYLRSFFKKLNCNSFTNCLSKSMPSKSGDTKRVIDRLVNFFVYQDTSSSKEYRLDEVLSYLRAEM